MLKEFTENGFFKRFVVYLLGVIYYKIPRLKYFWLIEVSEILIKL